MTEGFETNEGLNEASGMEAQDETEELDLTKAKKAEWMRKEKPRSLNFWLPLT